MYTPDEMKAAIDKDGEDVVATQMAMHQLDETLELLNKFVETNAAYRHPAVAVPYTIELLMTVFTEVIPKSDWQQVGDMVVQQVTDAMQRARETEAAEEPVNGES